MCLVDICLDQSYEKVMEQYDCIVIGTGGVGSAALYQLSQRGIRVLGFDRFPRIGSP